MTFVITQPCVGEKNTACVDVCPVNCIHSDGTQYYINPYECIDCAECVAACPVSAIFPEANVPAKWQAFIEKNRAFYEGRLGANGPLLIPAPGDLPVA